MQTLEAEEKERALEQAEKEKQEAIKAEQKKAEQAAKEKERAARQEVKRLQDKAEKEAAEVFKKQNNQKHRAKIHKEIKESLVATKLLSENKAIELVNIIISRKIKNITINYQ